ncbi:MAG: DUF4190 domain-containing protein [Mycobacterium sp.]|nr:DUF4190 domain-containing protein [Mycobacterium sp.]
MTEYPEQSHRPDSAPTPPPAPPYGQPANPYSYPPGPYPGSYPPPQMPYGDFYPAPPAPLRNGLGVAALVIAIIALVSSFSVAGGIVLGIVAVILGFLGRGRVKRGEANNGGVALSGIILGVVAIVVGLAFIAIWVGLFKEVGAGDYFDCLQQAGQDRAKVEQCSEQFRQSVENKFSETPTPGR